LFVCKFHSLAIMGITVHQRLRLVGSASGVAGLEASECAEKVVPEAIEQSRSKQYQSQSEKVRYH